MVKKKNFVYCFWYVVVDADSIIFFIISGKNVAMTAHPNERTANINDMNARISPCVHTVSLVLNLSKRKRKWFNTNRKRNYLLNISINNIHFRLIHYQVPINKFDHHVLIDYPGRTCTIVNDRLRRTTEIYRDRARLPYTTRVHGLIRRETDSVYGDRTKILSD